jgi:dolichol kinase
LPQPAFTSLAFSIAFAIFTFAEYARYFAVYPIGRPIHVFFSEFIDSKDAGPVILSHFYLLTGCAGGLWLEGRGIMNYTGVLAVGIGDAFVSPESVFSGGRLTVRTGIRAREATWAHQVAIQQQDGLWDCFLRGFDLLRSDAAASLRHRRAFFGKPISALEPTVQLSECDLKIPRYLLATTMAGLLEAVSAQNDNLIIPIFFWSLLSLLEV